MMRLLPIVSAAAVLAALPTAAVAAVLPPEFAAEANTAAVSLSVFEAAVGAEVLDLGTTGVDAASLPWEVTSSTSPASVLDQPLLQDAYSVTSTGGTVTLPDGEPCVLPVSVTGLDVDVLCAQVTATAGGTGSIGAMTGAAEIGVASVDADGSLVSNALTSELDALLEELLTGVGADLLAEGVAGLSVACDEVLATIGLVLDPLDVVPDTSAELLALTGADLDAAVEVLELVADPSCLQLLDLSVAELSQDLVDVTPVAAALDGVGLVDLSLSFAESGVGGQNLTVTAAADQTFVTIDGPSLDVLDDAITAVVQGAVDGIVEELSTAAGTDLTGGLDVAGAVAAVLDEVPLVDAQEPLVTATISGGSAFAIGDTGELTVMVGGERPFVMVAISPAVLELFGLDPGMGTVVLSAGQTETIAGGTPLESTISIGDLVTDEDATHDATGLSGASARTSGITVSLLSGIEGGIELVIGGAFAAAYVEGDIITGTVDPGPSGTPPGGTPGPDGDPTGDQELPNTGGGAALLAVAAIGGALALGRRRRG